MRIRVSVLRGRLCLKIITRVLDYAIIISITTARVTIIHDTANTKAALQTILVTSANINSSMKTSILPHTNSIRRFKPILLILSILVFVFITR